MRRRALVRASGMRYDGIHMANIVVTGTGRGIGKALARKFAAEGHSVTGTYLSGDAEKGACEAVWRLDLSSQESIASCAEEIARSGRKIDILVNNAGILLDEDETAVDIPKLRRTMEVNVIGTADFTERMVPLMAEGGHIVNISSTAGSLELVDDGKSHYPGRYPAYKISKAALNMYTRTLAGRLMGHSAVSSVHPGWVRTDMGGPEADMSPEEAAEGIYALAVARPETGQFWFKGEKIPW